MSTNKRRNQFSSLIIPQPTYHGHIMPIVDEQSIVNEQSIPSTPERLKEELKKKPKMSHNSRSFSCSSLPALSSFPSLSSTDQTAFVPAPPPFLYHIEEPSALIRDESNMSCCSFDSNQMEIEPFGAQKPHEKQYENENENEERKENNQVEDEEEEEEMVPNEANLVSCAVKETVFCETITIFNEEEDKQMYETFNSHTKSKILFKMYDERTFITPEERYAAIVSIMAIAEKSMYRRETVQQTVMLFDLYLAYYFANYHWPYFNENKGVDAKELAKRILLTNQLKIFIIDSSNIELVMLVCFFIMSKLHEVRKLNIEDVLAFYPNTYDATIITHLESHLMNMALKTKALFHSTNFLVDKYIRLLMTKKPPSLAFNFSAQDIELSADPLAILMNERRRKKHGSTELCLNSPPLLSLNGNHLPVPPNGVASSSSPSRSPCVPSIPRTIRTISSSSSMCSSLSPTPSERSNHPAYSMTSPPTPMIPATPTSSFSSAFSPFSPFSSSSSTLSASHTPMTPHTPKTPGTPITDIPPPSPLSTKLRSRLSDHRVTFTEPELKVQRIKIVNLMDVAMLYHPFLAFSEENIAMAILFLAFKTYTITLEQFYNLEPNLMREVKKCVDIMTKFNVTQVLRRPLFKIEHSIFANDKDSKHYDADLLYTYQTSWNKQIRVMYCKMQPKQTPSSKCEKQEEEEQEQEPKKNQNEQNGKEEQNEQKMKAVALSKRRHQSESNIDYYDVSAVNRQFLQLNLMHRNLNNMNRLGIYCKIKDLSCGAYGIVSLCMNNLTREKVVIKYWKMFDQARTSYQHYILREIIFLKSLDHPNIIALRDFISINVNSGLEIGYNDQQQLVCSDPVSVQALHALNRFIQSSTSDEQHENATQRQLIQQHLQQPIPCGQHLFMVIDFFACDLREYCMMFVKAYHSNSSTSNSSNSNSSPFQVAAEIPSLYVKEIMKQLFSALDYCAEHSVCHRDIKPPNILIDPASLRIKLIDFGMARLRTQPFDNTMQTEEVVTSWYRPPELLLGDCRYSYAIDIWSTGCVFAELLGCGEPLFPCLKEEDQLNLIFSKLGTPTEEDLPSLKTAPKHALPKQQYKRDMNVPLVAKCADAQTLDLLESMLRYNPDKRITAAQALQHPYFST